MSEAAVRKRAHAFRRMDVNGNGILSLAEVDKGVRDVFKLGSLFGIFAMQVRADDTLPRHVPDAS